jgi:hypothetical protein
MRQLYHDFVKNGAADTKKRQNETRQEHPGILNLPLNSDEINEKIHFLQTLLHLRDV